MWTKIERLLLDAILDMLIPPSEDGKILGAGALGVADFFLNADAYAVDPVGAAQAVIAASGNDFITLSQDKKINILKQIEATHPQAFATLVRVTYMGYYSRPDTRLYFGVGAHPVHPKGYPVSPESDAVMEELTAPVRARRKMYRDVT